MDNDLFLLKVSDFDRRILVRALSDLKDRQKSEHKDCTYLDYLIVKVCDAPKQKVKLFHEER